MNVDHSAAPARSATSLAKFLECIDLFQCPLCAGGLAVDSDSIKCQGCGASYPVWEGIPCLYVPTDADQPKEAITTKIREFYEETPFPNYQDCESIEDLIAKAEKGQFARLLNDQLPFNAKVLEVGCGTGQLSNYLSTAQRTHFGADMTLHSLKLANEFKTAQGLDRVGFVQMNLYRPAFRPETFDVVLCNGVLCATIDPDGGWESISKLVKPGGHILLGLYNTYGRWITDFRRILINNFGDQFTVLDPHLRNKSLSDAKRKAWYQDQYKHPNECKHTFGDVLKWFEQEGFEFTYGIPSLRPFESFSAEDRIFEAHNPGTKLDHFLVQARMIFEGSYEGGFFTMIGRRK